MKNIKTRETFTSANGSTINYAELLCGIANEVAALIRSGFITKDEGEEIEQDACVKACAHCASFDERKAKASTFGAMIALRCARTAVRAKSSRPDMLSISSAYDECKENEGMESEDRICSSVSSDADLCYSESADWTLRESMMRDALDQVEKKMSATGVMVLEKTICGYSAKEIAQEANMSEQAVYSQLHRARKNVSWHLMA